MSNLSIEALAKALKVSTELTEEEKERSKLLRESYVMSLLAAQEVVLSDKVLNRITNLVETVDKLASENEFLRGEVKHNCFGMFNISMHEDLEKAQEKLETVDDILSSYCKNMCDGCHDECGIKEVLEIIREN